METLWRAAGMTAIVGTCAATSYAPVFTGLLLLALAGFRAIGWWRLDRDGWLEHPALQPWRPMIRVVTVAELSASALLIVLAIVMAGGRYAPVIVSAAQAGALAATGLQLIGLLIVVRSLWRRLQLPEPEWFDDLSLPAMIAGCIGILQVPVARAVAALLPQTAGDRLLVLATVLWVIGLVALVFALFVLVDRAGRVVQAAGLLGGLDLPSDLDPDWDGTRRPTPKRADSAALPPRVRPTQDEDAIPLD